MKSNDKCQQFILLAKELTFFVPQRKNSQIIAKNANEGDEENRLTRIISKYEHYRLISENGFTGPNELQEYKQNQIKKKNIANMES